MPKKKNTKSKNLKTSKKKTSPKRVNFKKNEAKRSKNDFVGSVSSQLKLKESYASLFLGVLVVVVAIALGGLLLRNKGYTNNKNLKQPTEISSPSTKEEVRTYTVQEGEGLFEISQKIYGNGDLWIKIAEANNLTNPDQIETGMTLTIPRE